MASTDKKSIHALTPDKIAVIICGYPEQTALDVAHACVKRGYKVAKFGLTTADTTSIDVPEVGKVTLTKFSAPDSKAKLQEAIKLAEKEGLFPVVADTTSVDGNVSVYNDLKVPFVLQSKGGESHLKAVKDTEQAKTFALISEGMNKRLAAFDAMWEDWSKRFPGLLADHDLVAKTKQFVRDIHK